MDALTLAAGFLGGALYALARAARRRRREQERRLHGRRPVSSSWFIG